MTAHTPKPQIDTSKPHPARVYDWLLGGKDNYPVDQALGKSLPSMMVDGARHNRAFMNRAVAWLAAERGIDQFLDIGTGIPTVPNLHQVAQGIRPRTRVVYADNDTIVLRHAEALMSGTEEGETDYIQADVRDPQGILEPARRVLDFGRPVALSLIALMHFIPDSDGPYEIVQTYLDALVPGSYLVLSHGTFDFHPELRDKVTGDYGQGGIELVPRSHKEVLGFFQRRLTLVAPGLVTAPRWRPGFATPPSPVPAPMSSGPSAMYAGVAVVGDRDAA
ncbi:SAM-dependent methyltransferase [Streptomyces niveus]|uniref:SAM-dependent methyltransferase n=1 Tax=Streptomyces niveus TaxID=193462 RepID=UPI003443DC40